MRRRRLRSAAVALTVAAAACGAAPRPAARATPAPTSPPSRPSRPPRATDTLPRDPDDPAIWVNRLDASKSLVLGTMKVAAPDGALAVFGIDGKLRQLLKGPDRPNNVDVEYGLDLDATPTDIAVLTERLGRRLRVYAIAARRQRRCATSRPAACRSSRARPETRARRWASVCTAARRTARSSRSSRRRPGRSDNYLWQYRLEDDGTGRVKATFVRRFGTFSGIGEIEAIAIDDELGVRVLRRRSRRDPQVAGRSRCARRGSRARAVRDEGLSAGSRRDRDLRPAERQRVHRVASISCRARASSTSTDAKANRDGPHDHSTELLSFKGGADGTDGLDVTSASLGAAFPDGLIVAMNSSSRNFVFFRWHDVAAAAQSGARADRRRRVVPDQRATARSSEALRSGGIGLTLGFAPRILCCWRSASAPPAHPHAPHLTLSVAPGSRQDEPAPRST